MLIGIPLSFMKAKWYRDGDLEPKFKYLMIFVLITVLITAIALNLYAWVQLLKVVLINIEKTP
jgi:hypothetical protein